MIDEVIATDPAAVQGQQMTVKAADNGDEIAGILDGVTVGCGPLLDRIGTIGDGSSIRHDLLLEVTDFKEQAGV